MSDNVIILGAGASFDAGVPLSAGFIDKMREYYFKGKSKEGPLSDSDKEIFRQAMEVMTDVDKYHGRAEFDDRNLEDILSLLSFNIIGGTQTEKDSLNLITKAIARTIELSCMVKHNGELNRLQSSKSSTNYIIFWEALFQRYKDTLMLPTILTFNYDLVLERALFQLLISKGIKQFPFDGFILRYHYKGLAELCYKIVPAEYRDPGDHTKKVIGTALDRCKENELNKAISIEILKLHGSLNFPNNVGTEKLEYQPPTNLVSDPFIIPPISNKSISEDAEEIWKEALNNLRNAKNIVIVGYSLPPTDIYVQYFLKTALGPNMDLTRITVFNPDLHTEIFDSPMKDRYSRCFSRQVMNRIINFGPKMEIGPGRVSPGTFHHFVRDIINPNNDLFF